LAGKSLIFDITIKSITPKSETSSEQIVSEIEG
jgi:FKBP-type peptidyl-prolyl cis-trans isomerase 2